MPDSRRCPEADALAALEAAGLAAGDAAEASDATIVAGNVISSDPAAAPRSPPAREVGYVALLTAHHDRARPRRPAPRPTPSPPSRRPSLVAGDRSEAFSDSVAAGSVIGQDPAPDSEVELGSAVAYRISLGIEQVEVPAFVERSLAEAEALAAEARLELATSDVETNEAAPGTVLAQEPAPGSRVDVGSQVRLSLAVAPPTTTVPDLVDLPEADALAALEAAELVAGDRSEAFSDSVAAGSVIGQDPAPDSEVELGSAVAYRISLGIEQVEVPAFVERSLAEAEALAAEARLELATSDVETNEAAPGTVLAQEPAPGSRVDVGSQVRLSLAVAPPTTTVPDLVDLPEADALAALEAAELVAGDRSEAFSDSVAAGSVIGQDPAPDSEVELGSAVAYRISLGIEQVEVPAFVERSLAEAEALAAEARLELATSDVETNEAAPGTVLAQEPAPGSRVDVGSQVRLSLAVAPPTTTVPDLVDLPEADALAALEAAELVAGDRSEAFSDSVAAGSVIGQDPPPTARSSSAAPSPTASAWASSRSRCPPSSSAAWPRPRRSPPRPASSSPPATSRPTRPRPAPCWRRSPRPAAASTSARRCVSRWRWHRPPPPCPTSSTSPRPTPSPPSRRPSSWRVTAARPSATASRPAASSTRIPPPTARSRLGSAVAYRISLGIEQVEVPAFVGRSLAEAEALAAEARLELASQRRRDQRGRARHRAGAGARARQPRRRRLAGASLRWRWHRPPPPCPTSSTCPRPTPSPPSRRPSSWRVTAARPSATASRPAASSTRIRPRQRGRDRQRRRLPHQPGHRAGRGAHLQSSAAWPRPRRSPPRPASSSPAATSRPTRPRPAPCWRRSPRPAAASTSARRSPMVIYPAY